MLGVSCGDAAPSFEVVDDQEVAYHLKPDCVISIDQIAKSTQEIIRN